MAYPLRATDEDVAWSRDMTTSLGAKNDLRAKSSTAMTGEERSILALERIADEMTLLNQSIERLLDRDEAVAATKTDGGGNAPTSGEAADDRAIEDGDMKPHAADRYSVGGHRYVNLHQAIENARHARDAAKDGEGGA